MDSDDHIDIRQRVRAHGARELAIARLGAPEDWQAALRSTLAEQRGQRDLWSRDGDLRLFFESFAIFFTATIIFLL